MIMKNQAAVAAKGKKKGKKLAQVPVIVKRRAVEDPTSAAAKIEALPYVAEEALMETTNKKEKAKIKKGLKELSDRRGRIAISMEESAKLENAIETAWKKADAIKKREEIKQNKAAVKEARIATKIAIRRDAANRKAQAEKSGKAPELTTQQRFNEAQKALKDRGVSFNIKE
ncbi:MAG: hypothetical protein NT128_02540 [Proteobacteria bacterium]|nr:hypothetical protein [Pseudomonadota bacterium]